MIIILIKITNNNITNNITDGNKLIYNNKKLMITIKMMKIILKMIMKIVESI